MGWIGAKASKTNTNESVDNTLDPEISKRLYESADDIKKRTEGILGDGPIDSFTGKRTDTFKNFIDKANNPSVSSGDFRSISEKMQNPTKVDWKSRTIGDLASTGPTALGEYARGDAQRVADYGDTAGVNSTNISAKQGADFMDRYKSSYTNDVVDAALGDLGAQRNKTQVQSDMAASAAGAAGGSRHGIRDAEVTNDYLRNVAGTTANLRDKAFNTAAAYGMQDAGNDLTASQSNQSAALTAAQATAAARNAALASQFTARNTALGNDAAAEERRRAELFGATNTRNAADAAAERTRLATLFAAGEKQGQTDQTGEFTAGSANADRVAAGLKDSADTLKTGAAVDASNIGILGGAAEADQAKEDEIAADKQKAIELRLRSLGLLPAVVDKNSKGSATSFGASIG